MRISTIKSIATGGVLGLAIGTGMMMMPQGKRMRRVLSKNAPALARQMIECWIK